MDRRTIKSLNSHNLFVFSILKLGLWWDVFICSLSTFLFLFRTDQSDHQWVTADLIKCWSNWREKWIKDTRARHFIEDGNNLIRLTDSASEEGHIRLPSELRWQSSKEGLKNHCSSWLLIYSVKGVAHGVESTENLKLQSFGWDGFTLTTNQPRFQLLAGSWTNELC